jgi:ABC-type nitrate/sulfonate/bicarbonate transport system substrate-binding protein
MLRREFTKLALGLPLALASSRGARAQTTTITVMVFLGMQTLPLLAARSRGFFAGRGLRVEVLNTKGAGELPVGLVDGRWQIVHSTSDNAVGMVDVDKLDVALIIGGDNAFNHLIVRPDINSISELRGKTIVVDTATSGYAYLLYALLKKHGLNTGDYIIKPVGATARRLEAMQVDSNNKAAILNQPFAIQAVKSGLKDLGTTSSMMGPYQGTSGYTLKSWAAANSETLVRYLQAYIEGLRWVLDPANKDGATKVLADGLGVPSDIAAAMYAIVTDKTDGFIKDGAFDLEGFQNVLKLRAEYLGRQPEPPGKYLDLSYYRRALATL